jgi:hypothetical protein
MADIRPTVPASAMVFREEANADPTLVVSDAAAREPYPQNHQLCISLGI